MCIQFSGEFWCLVVASGWTGRMRKAILKAIIIKEEERIATIYFYNL
jgi:hypothetical protein